MQQARLEKFPKEGNILVEGDVPRGLFQIHKGSVRVQKQNIVLARIRTGEMFGEIAFLVGGEATASIVADSDEVEVFVLDTNELRREFEKDCGLAEKFFKSLCRTIAERVKKSSAQATFKNVERVVDHNMVAKMKDPKNGVPVKDRKHLLKTFTNCFVGMYDLSS
jgi:CRP-like cAMP-binding protein